MLKRLKGKLNDAVKKTNKKIALVLSAAVVTVTCCGFGYASPNDVTIVDSGSAPVQIKTTDTNVGKILSKQGIILNEGDRVNYELTDNVNDNAVIRIKRAISVDIYHMGKTRSYLTTETNVAKILQENGISVTEDCTVVPGVDEDVADGDIITVIARDTHDVTVQEEVDYAVIENENSDLAPGERVVVQRGEKGVKEYTYQIRYQDGTEIDRILVDEAVLSEPIDEIVECGPESVWELGVIPASRPTNYSRMETFTATAYDASPADNGKWAGKTSTGMPLTYGVVAVDPKVIPYGTKMYIESADGQYVYGYAIAGDCGGAIKGKKVDLFFESRSTCYQFGRRAVNIYFLD